MGDSFDAAVLVENMRKQHPGDDIFIEKSNDKRIVVHPQDEITAICGFLFIIKPNRDIAINPRHIISVINKGDLV